MDAESYALLIVGGALLLAAVAWGCAAYAARCIRRDMTWTDAEE